MPSAKEQAAARETMIPAQTGHVSESIVSSHRKTWRFWSGACFAIVLPAAFAQPLLALINYAAGSQLYSLFLLIPFVSAYLLYLRRDQLPKKYVTDLPLAIVSLAGGLAILAITWWLDFAKRAPTHNDYLALLALSFLCCLAAGGFFFFGRCGRRAAALPLTALPLMVLPAAEMGAARGTASRIASAQRANAFSS